MHEAPTLQYNSDLERCYKTKAVLLLLLLALINVWLATYDILSPTSGLS